LQEEQANVYKEKQIVEL